MSDFFVQFLNGVTIAMTIYLIASGLSLVFGVLGVLNFAHGSLYMYGSFLLFTLMRHVFGTPSSFWVGLLLVVDALFAKQVPVVGHGGRGMTDDRP